jgi:3-deoxy-7-phosphoheptulonate synthase
MRALQGNPFTHVILRGSSKGPNYAAEHVSSCVDKLAKAGVTTKLMVSLIESGLSNPCR